MKTLHTFNLDGIAQINPPTPEAPRIGLDHDPRLTRRATTRQHKRLIREQNAIEQIERLPANGEDVFLILTGNYHGWDVLTAIIELAGCDVGDLTVATLGFNNTQADHLAEMLDAGTVGKCTFIVSEMFSQKNPDEYDHLKDVLKSRGHRIAANRNHCKIMLIRLADGQHIVTHGSLNLRRCNSYEQMVITQDRALYDFFNQFIEDILQ